MTEFTSDTCDHGVSWQIQPPDESGWMRESCGSCEQVLRYTLWPHHQRAVEALADRGDGDAECTCATCADTVARRTIEPAIRNIQGDRAWVRDQLSVLDDQQLQQLRDGARRLATCAQTELGILHANP